jgi:cytochrome c oxidase subunit II
MLLIGAAASIVGIAITLAMDWFPEQGSTAADDIDTLYDVLLIASVPVFVLVMTIAIYSVIRFRAKPGDLSDGAPIHGNTRLEIIWVTIPFIMVTALAIYGWIVLDDIEAKKPNELRVNVTGQQFAWRFEYPAQKVQSNQLVLPKDRPVHFYITSDDVIHSFWVPEFRLKSDAVPGLTTHIRLTPNSIDKYPVVCAELCGLGHSTMRQQVRVIQPAEWDRWVAERQERAEGGGGGEQAAADGKAIFTETGCNACHTLADAGATGNVGPALDELAASAPERKPGTAAEAYVEESITDPRAFVVEGFPGNVMPTDYAEQLSPEEIDALVQYLLGASK